MNEEMERLAKIEPGDSNVICLAKTMQAVADNWTFLGVDTVVLPLIEEGMVYAQEVLDGLAD